jgi:hypothetical protein
MTNFNYCYFSIVGIDQFNLHLPSLAEKLFEMPQKQDLETAGKK